MLSCFMSEFNMATMLVTDLGADKSRDGAITIKITQSNQIDDHWLIQNNVKSVFYSKNM